MGKHPDRFVTARRVPADERCGGCGAGGGTGDRHARLPSGGDLHRYQRPPGGCAGVSSAVRANGAYDLPILLHPRHTNTAADYDGEPTSKFLVYTNFGWPFETSKAMARLAFGGVLERFPTLKVITHHAGGLIPYFHKRVELSWAFNERRMGYRHDGETLSKSPLDYYQMFYCDTAIQGNTAALMCAWEFFGPDHMVFATDAPYDDELGARLYRETLPAVEAMPIGAAEKERIWAENARRLFRLPSRNDR